MNRNGWPPPSVARSFSSKRQLRLRVPDVVSVTLSNGIAVVLVRDPRVPLVNLQWIVAAGALDDPAGLDGVAALAMPSLMDGTENRDAARLARESERRGADLMAVVDWRRSFLALELLPRDLAFGLDLLADLATHPVFPEPALERRLHRSLLELRRQRHSAEATAARAFAQLVFDAPRAGTPLAGEEASLRRLRRSDIATFHRHGLLASPVTVLGVGALKVDEALRLIEDLPRWNGRAAAAEELYRCAQKGGGFEEIHWVEVPGAPQAEVRVGCACPGWREPEFRRLHLLAAILGGYPGSRLDQILREEMGLTYQVDCRLVERGDDAALQIRAAVPPKEAARAISFIRAGIDHLRAHLAPAEEIAGARNYLAGRLLRSLETIRGLAQLLRETAAGTRLEDAIHNILDDLLAVDAAGLRNLAERRLHPGVAVVATPLAAPGRQPFSPRLDEPVSLLHRAEADQSPF